MRSRQDFRDMATDCDKIFSDERLKSLNLRYFDPTLSATEGHEDKGLIECLMVKCAKARQVFSSEHNRTGIRMPRMVDAGRNLMSRSCFGVNLKGASGWTGMRLLHQPKVNAIASFYFPSSL